MQDIKGLPQYLACSNAARPSLGLLTRRRLKGGIFTLRVTCITMAEQLPTPSAGPTIHLTVEFGCACCPFRTRCEVFLELILANHLQRRYGATLRTPALSSGHHPSLL